MAKRLLAVLGGALVFVVMTSCGDQTTSTSSPAAAATAAVIPSPQVLLDITGSNTNTTQKFSAAGDWDLQWTYDCTAFVGDVAGGHGNFIVEVRNSDGTSSQNQGVNQLGVKDQGVEHFHLAGTFYLEVTSECAWTIKVIG
ncbi:MAG TPA: hypothetical protein VNF26_01130 [Candidatus Baltobacterales bacterium]|nr:hypothetical protein [Candidatus Baltobacterales bacterium]